MEIKIKANIRTKAFDHIRNKQNLEELFLWDLAKVFGLKKPIAKQQIKIKVTWEETKDELL